VEVNEKRFSDHRELKSCFYVVVEGHNEKTLLNRELIVIGGHERQHQVNVAVSLIAVLYVSCVPDFQLEAILVPLTDDSFTILFLWSQ
jgi:hypothetical protein